MGRRGWANPGHVYRPWSEERRAKAAAYWTPERRAEAGKRLREAPRKPQPASGPKPVAIVTVGDARTWHHRRDQIVSEIAALAKEAGELTQKLAALGALFPERYEAIFGEKPPPFKGR